MRPDVSIITPCYNASRTLEATVQSVLSQHYKSWELILVDDKSDDDTIFKAQEYCNRDSRIKLIALTENSGAAIARNAGITQATGRYIAFIDADDLWEQSKLKTQISLMKKNSWALSYTAYSRIKENGASLNTVGVPERVDYRHLLKTNYIGCSTAIYDSDQLGKVLMPLLRKRQDYGLWLKILKKNQYGYGINQPLTLYRVQQGSLSANKRKTSQYNWLIYRREEGLSLLASAYYFTHYAIRGVLRTHFPRIAKKTGCLHSAEHRH
ncbi:glycosyltransferase family 2 protein [Alcanivorax profundi]|uniref:glycosyltransferase family 2 protein n=1 Tax=Alcanivorax profundi TaxID=2338368 RepID=UPI0032B283A2